jgi:isoleucyl-tRNA synthetase
VAFVRSQPNKINKTRCPKIKHATLGRAQNFTKSLRFKSHEYQLLHITSKKKKFVTELAAAFFQNLKEKFLQPKLRSVMKVFSVCPRILTEMFEFTAATIRKA